jgi:hypothetical protein
MVYNPVMTDGKISLTCSQDHQSAICIQVEKPGGKQNLEDLRNRQMALAIYMHMRYRC